jgi:adenylate cyclase
VRRLVSVVLLTLAITGVAWVGLSAGVFAGFQRRATDNLFPAAPTDRRVVVVGIDGDAVHHRGYPLPRAVYTDLLARLQAAGARTAVIDVQFRAEAPEQVPIDADFAHAISEFGDVVLAGESVAKAGDLGLQMTDDLVYAPGLVGSGFRPGVVTVFSDPNDGVYRAVPLIFESRDGEVVPGLSLAALMAYRRIDGPPIVRPDGVQVGDRFIPTSSDHSMLVNFSTRLSNPTNYIPIGDVLDDKVPTRKLEGKIVLVGAIDSSLGDNKNAPVNKSTGIPGVLLHANALNTMLTSTYLAPVSDSTTLLWVALVTALVALAVVMLPFWLSPFVAFLIAAAYFVFCIFRFYDGHIQNVVYPLIAVVLSFIGAMGIRYFSETRQRRRVTTLFSQYVPETVAQRLVEHQDLAEHAAEGERLEMTVLFCDLRGFTAMSENLSPGTVRVMLNHYYDRVTDAVLEMRGTLMKYVGDEVFAVWGAPLPSDDDPARALACAIAIQQLTPQLNRELLELGAPEVSFGIGLNSGEAVAAPFGGGRRRQYDVVGDTVNVGARLCSAAGRGEVIISDEVLRRVPDPPEVEPLGHTELKGVSRELRLWRVVLPDSVPAEVAPAAVGTQAAGVATGDVASAENGSA